MKRFFSADLCGRYVSSLLSSLPLALYSLPFDAFYYWYTCKCDCLNTCCMFWLHIYESLVRLYSISGSHVCVGIFFLHTCETMEYTRFLRSLPHLEAFKCSFNKCLLNCSDVFLFGSKFFFCKVVC